MVGWKKILLMGAGLGGGFAIVTALTLASWTCYQNRPKSWDARAIVATFDYPDTQSGEPEGPNGLKTADTIVLYYTLENTTGVDYRMPTQDQLELDGRLKREKSLTGSMALVTLDKEQVFIPSKQRRRFAVNLHYPVTENFGAEPKTREEYRKRWKLIAEYMKKEFTNLDGFTLFDSANRFQINLPDGWDNLDLR